MNAAIARLGLIVLTALGLAFGAATVHESAAVAQPIPLTGRQGIYEVSEEVMRSPRAKPQSTQSPDKCEDLLAH